MKKVFYLILNLFLLFSSCSEGTSSLSSNTTKNTLTRSKAILTFEKELLNLSSGSGMQYLKGGYYAVGDDDPFLWKFDENGNILDKWVIWDTTIIEQGRIPKKVKPDFESISLFPYQTDTSLLIFSSGSKAVKRDHIIVFNLEKQQENNVSIFAKPFYKTLRSKVFTKKTLNLEGATFWDNQLFLLNRPTNSLLSISKEHFTQIISKDSEHSPTYPIQHLTLPEIDNDTARFSGGSILTDLGLLLFSAAIEQSDDSGNDGGIVGSFIGLIDLNDPERPIILCEKILRQNGTIFKGKVESVHGKIVSDSLIKVVGITDNDDGKTHLLHIELNY